MRPQKCNNIERQKDCILSVYVSDSTISKKRLTPSSNVLYRSCNRITPAQIDTHNITHLIFAFASIDPQSFNITPTSSDDTALYPQFTALKSALMQTWIGLGGGGFSDPGPTHTTWSDMASNSSRRAAFIMSLIGFMEKWGFQGVDLDWEFPVDSAHGGSPGDFENFVDLLSEMRAAFGNRYGISVAL